MVVYYPARALKLNTEVDGSGDWSFANCDDKGRLIVYQNASIYAGTNYIGKTRATDGTNDETLQAISATLYGHGVGLFDAAGNRMPSMDAAARKGYVSITDGTNTMPTGDAVARPLFVKITDGTEVVDVTTSKELKTYDPKVYAQVETNTHVEIYTRLGAPAGASVSADIAAVKADTAAILTDTGTTLPTSIASNLTAIQTLGTAALETEADASTRYTNIYNRLGAPAGASMSADVAAIKSDTAAILTDTGTTLNDKIDTIDGYHDVPSADSGANTQMRDVVGNKNDTIDGNSLISWFHKLKIITLTQETAFFGETSIPTGWTEQLTGGTATYNVTWAGGVALDTGATAGQIAGISKDAKISAGIAHSWDRYDNARVEWNKFVIEWLGQLENNANMTATHTFMGLGAAGSNNGGSNNLAGFRWDGTQIETVTDSGGTETTNDTTLDVDYAHLFRMELSNGQIAFYANGSLLFTHTTNISTALLYFLATVKTDANDAIWLQISQWRSWYE